MLIEVLIGNIVRETGVSLQEMMQDGLVFINHFRANPVNKEAIADVYMNSVQSPQINHPDDAFRISKYGEQKAMELFMNNVITLFQLRRDTLYPKMPQDVGLAFHQKVTKFYMTYALATVSALLSKQTTMTDASVAIKELRQHFLEEFLIDYVNYM